MASWNCHGGSVKLHMHGGACETDGQDQEARSIMPLVHRMHGGRPVVRVGRADGSRFPDASDHRQGNASNPTGDERRGTVVWGGAAAESRADSQTRRRRDVAPLASIGVASRHVSLSAGQARPAHPQPLLGKHYQCACGH